MSFITSFNPFDFTKNFAFGLGLGVGIGVIVRRVMHEKMKHKELLISCLKQLTTEVQQLRETILSMARDLNNQCASLSDSEEYFDANNPPCTESLSENLQFFVKEVDSLIDGDDEQQVKAYNLLLNKTKQIPDNVDLLWRYAKSQYRISCQKEKSGDHLQHKSLIDEGIKTAERALHINDNCYQAHQWFAVLIGTNIKFQETKQKFLLGNIYKAHIEKAILLNPDDAASYYFLGRYLYEIYMLPWYIRKAAAAIFSETPTATVDDALQCFLKAEQLKSGYSMGNSFYLGKCYYYKNCLPEARKWFFQVTSAVPMSDEDESFHKEATELLKKL
nr:regulator of microtubule dynamics protein 3 [Hydra vulgaris]XP_047133553.1 regulator of microtubule dynamics protein 3 [Hydra vulgaris]